MLRDVRLQGACACASGAVDQLDSSDYLWTERNGSSTVLI